MIKDLMDSNETIVWEGKPDRFTYVIGTLGQYVFAILWGAFDFGFISLFLSGGAGSGMGKMGLFLVPFFLIHLMPVWLAIGGPIYRALNWKTIHYVITEKHVYIESGLVGRDVNIINFSDIYQPEVTVGFIERMRNCGTIRLSPSLYSDRKGRARTSFKATLAHIAAPYDIFKLIKHIADVTRTGPGGQVRESETDSISTES